MQRRRFVPRSEGLEGRQLLSGIGPNAPAAAEIQQGAPNPLPVGVLRAAPFQAARTATPGTGEGLQRGRATFNPNDPNLGPLQSFRIDRLPNLLESVRRGRVLPPEIVSGLQDDLRAISGTLRPAPSAALNAFNQLLRSTLSTDSLRPENALALNRAFGQILTLAGGAPETVASFQANMNALAHFDSSQPNPSPLAANDYAVMLQSALATGADFQALMQRPRTAQGLQAGLNPRFGR